MHDIERIINEHENRNFTGRQVLSLDENLKNEFLTYITLKSSVTNIFDELNKTEELENISITEYSNLALIQLSDILKSSVNMWIDTDSRKIPNNKRAKEKPDRRFRRKFYSTSRPFVPERVNSTIFENAVHQEKGVIGEGVERRDGFNSNTYIISPLNYLDEKAVLAISKREDNSDFDHLSYIELKVADYFSAKLERSIGKLHQHNFDKLVKDVYDGGKGRKILEGIDSRTRNIESYAILFLDIDDFKPINDKYGHEKGDEVLKRLGYVLRKMIRKNDIVYRNGGEEFVVAMLNVDQDDIAYKARELREHIKQDLQNQFAMPITVSVGYNLISPEDDTDIAKKVSDADIAMYNAKQVSGKNSQVGYVEGMKMPEIQIEKFLG